MAKPGPKSSYTQAIGDEICRRISLGETLADICRDLKLSRFTVDQWRDDQPAFKAAYLDARTKGYDVIAEDCLAIADESSRDFKNGQYDAEHVQRSKLRIETRLKLLAKWDPRRYGDKHILAGDPGNPVQIETIKRVIVDGNTDTDSESL